MINTALKKKKKEASTVKSYVKTHAENEREINLKKIFVTSRKSMEKENSLPAWLLCFPSLSQEYYYTRASQPQSCY